MPPDTVKVDRSTKWGNPFLVFQGDVAFAVGAFRRWLDGEEKPYLDARRSGVLRDLPQLRGKKLACWCPLDRPCHADVLLELANR